MNDLRSQLSFGFEQTFTTPDWWMDPGFVANSNTPLKLEKMKALAENLATISGGSFIESADVHSHLQYETFDGQGHPSFVVTMDPGSIEVKTQPLLISEIEARLNPLFEAAERSGLVPYRNWWYGIRTGTEGGCHINLAGLSPATNPLVLQPELVIAYITTLHNHPCLTYPFMGVDVGPGGNCMRMDEHALDPHAHHAPGKLNSLEKLSELIARCNSPSAAEGSLRSALSAEAIQTHFAGSKLAEDKHSAPSLYKYRAPLFFIEDRAVEALRSAHEVFLLCELRIRILESLQRDLQKGAPLPTLQTFSPGLHEDQLASLPLWRQFQNFCRTLQVDPVQYLTFFDRQFPRLTFTAAPEIRPPKFLELREGRRPRVIRDIQMRGDLIISKTIDTSFARLEILWPAELGAECLVNRQLLKAGTQERDATQMRHLVIDFQKSGRNLEFVLFHPERKEVIEAAAFSPSSMMFVAAEKLVLCEGMSELAPSRPGSSHFVLLT
ncbi:MAG: transglutaminase family protein [Methylotenera sp.]|nr:transglutaminase family protein [Oligoflexia bacterium]